MKTINKRLEKFQKIIDKEKIRNIILASTTGKTGLAALDIFNNKKYNVIIVKHCPGYDYRDMTKDVKEKIQKQFKLLQSTEPFGGLDISIGKKYNLINPTHLGLIEDVLKIIGEGFKVCVEIAMMVVDAGIIKDGELVASIAGSGGQIPDTLVIAKATSSTNLFQFKVINLYKI